MTFDPISNVAEYFAGTGQSVLKRTNTSIFNVNNIDVSMRPSNQTETMIANIAYRSNIKVLFIPMLSDIRKSTASLKRSQAKPACPSDDSSIKMNMNMEQWWNDTDRGKL